MLRFTLWQNISKLLIILKLPKACSNKQAVWNPFRRPVDWLGLQPNLPAVGRILESDIWPSAKAMCVPCSTNKCRIQESDLRADCAQILIRPSETWFSDGLMFFMFKEALSNTKPIDSATKYWTFSDTRQTSLWLVTLSLALSHGRGSRFLLWVRGCEYSIINCRINKK